MSCEPQANNDQSALPKCCCCGKDVFPGGFIKCAFCVFRETDELVSDFKRQEQDLAVKDIEWLPAPDLPAGWSPPFNAELSWRGTWNLQDRRASVAHGMQKATADFLADLFNTIYHPTVGLLAKLQYLERRLAIAEEALSNKECYDKLQETGTGIQVP